MIRFPQLCSLDVARVVLQFRYEQETDERLKNDLFFVYNDIVSQIAFQEAIGAGEDISLPLVQKRPDDISGDNLGGGGHGE